jgi:hypothetical protein
MDDPMARPRTAPEKREAVPLSQAAEYLLEEARMVLPGLQALFGFQLIAVFNARFGELLSPGEQRLHLLAIVLVVAAIALIMSPAAYHRQSGPDEISETFIRLSTRLLLWSMPPLAVGICLDFYLIARIILNSGLVPLLAAGMLLGFLSLWFLLPRIRSLQRLVGGA